VDVVDVDSRIKSRTPSILSSRRDEVPILLPNPWSLLLPGHDFGHVVGLLRGYFWQWVVAEDFDEFTGKSRFPSFKFEGEEEWE